MKTNPLKILALLFSVSAAGAYVWHASREKAASSATPAPVMQTTEVGESKPGGVFTDEEVKATKELMLSDSKSADIVSSEGVRQMLQKEAEKKPPMITIRPEAMISSSKISRPIIRGEDVKLFVEPKEEPAATPVKPETLIPSSKNIDVLFRKEDVKKLVDPEVESNTEPSPK